MENRSISSPRISVNPFFFFFQIFWTDKLYEWKKINRGRILAESSFYIHNVCFWKRFAGWRITRVSDVEWTKLLFQWPGKVFTGIKFPMKLFFFFFFLNSTSFLVPPLLLLSFFLFSFISLGFLYLLPRRCCFSFMLVRAPFIANSVSNGPPLLFFYF